MADHAGRSRRTVTSLGAGEAALLWLAAGSAEHVWSLLNQLAGPDFSTIPRDIDWLLTMASLTEVAAGTGAAGLASEAVRLLEPYAVARR